MSDDTESPYVGPSEGEKPAAAETTPARPERKPRKRRKSLKPFGDPVWSGLGQVVYRRAPAVGQTMGVQALAGYAGPRIDRMIKGTVVDDFLQKLLLMPPDQAMAAAELFGPVLLAGMISRRPELAAHPMMASIVDAAFRPMVPKDMELDEVLRLIFAPVVARDPEAQADGEA